MLAVANSTWVRQPTSLLVLLQRRSGSASGSSHAADLIVKRVCSLLVVLICEGDACREAGVMDSLVALLQPDQELPSDLLKAVLKLMLELAHDPASCEALQRANGLPRIIKLLEYARDDQVTVVTTATHRLTKCPLAPLGTECTAVIWRAGAALFGSVNSKCIISLVCTPNSGVCFS